ncbi:MAG: class I SAM-dependent methyltransferase [Planctomycetes bacterium]|nr:class I SAM-dependent methyltransferase [Planctomycetota bacterium]
MKLAASPSPVRSEVHSASVPRDASVTAANRSGLLTRLFRRGLLRRLHGIEGGRITLVDGPVEESAGCEDSACLSATITVHDRRFYRRVALGGELGAAESYLDGEWECDDLTALFRVLARNLRPSVSATGTFWSRLAARFGHWLARNTQRGSRRNIEAHYDLGDDFFSLFLDPTMMYSSAIFEREEMSLEQAQLARLDRICRALELRPSDHVVEIGTGWGGFALHAARNYGCRVTTTTISQNQFETATRRVQQAGLQDRVTVLDRDYRDLCGTFDKLVSIEMIEAVGHRYFDTFFQQCGRLLNRHGRMLLQAIVMPENRYDQYLRSVDFIQKYIFPGGCLPSITAMQQSVARQTDLWLVQLEDFARHYARTVREWRGRFRDNLDRIRQLGYSDRFHRMWDYYLCYCEAAFEERVVGVVHAVWER